MPSWIIPALKAMLPHVGTIIDVARPVFTKKRGPDVAADVVQQQIAELQTAVSKNAENIQELATQLKRTVEAIEKAAQLADTRLRRVYILAVVAIVAAAVAVFAPLLVR